MTADERLATLLDERDEEIATLRAQLNEAHDALDRRLDSTSDWALAREIDDEHPGLPLPRLEVVMSPHRDLGWGHTVIEYRLVMRHLLGHLEARPLGRTVRRGSGGEPWPNQTTVPEHLSGKMSFDEWRISWAMPFRDGAHAVHDSAHLGLPLYVQTQFGMEPLISTGHQAEKGLAHRRQSTQPPTSRTRRRAMSDLLERMADTVRVWQETGLVPGKEADAVLNAAPELIAVVRAAQEMELAVLDMLQSQRDPKVTAVLRRTLLPAQARLSARLCEIYGGDDA